MSIELDDEELSSAGVPELTRLGKRIELLRLERRMSKRILAQRAGTSRQQLWRVMTGKSELTSSLCARLSEVLETDSRLLRDVTLEAADLPGSFGASGASRRADVTNTRAAAPVPGSPDSADQDNDRLCRTLVDYVTGPNGLERTFETFPLTSDGRRLKRVLLDAIEDIAIARSFKLPQSVFDMRRAVVNDDDV
jgi:transcriptional regulator with XRE-family HTH domain